MNKTIFLVFGVLIATSLASCNTDEVKVKGTVVFGSNYHIINCINTVNIFIDERHIGIIDFPVDSVPDCTNNYGLKEELVVGHHKYKAEIRPEQGTGCTKDIYGELHISEGGCETVFIDYSEIEWNYYQYNHKIPHIKLFFFVSPSLKNTNVAIAMLYIFCLV